MSFNYLFVDHEIIAGNKLICDIFICAKTFVLWTALKEID